jgi:hypothetical protein
MKNTKEKGIWIDKLRFTICYFGAVRDNYEVRNENYGFCWSLGSISMLFFTNYPYFPVELMPKARIVDDIRANYCFLGA